VTSTLAIEDDGRVKEYEGGYDDYLRQRPAEPSTEPRSTVEPTRTMAASTLLKPPAPRKLSYKERQELQALPGRIEALEAALQELHEAMADPMFYRRDGGEIARTRARLEELEQDLAAAYERWEMLEEYAD
jgi:ATP-binding cassette subfamily F protein uup